MPHARVMTRAIHADADEQVLAQASSILLQQVEEARRSYALEVEELKVLLAPMFGLKGIVWPG